MHVNLTSEDNPIFTVQRTEQKEFNPTLYIPLMSFEVERFNTVFYV
jgi:hypothetical protein